MTYRDLFYYAEQNGHADEPVIVYDDAEQEFYEGKKLAIVPEDDVLKNLIFEKTGKDKIAVVI